MIRTGIGYDVHRLAEGRKLSLGGVEIVHSRGLEGHSDADVLSHAIADALLGAIAAGDIGQHFPNTDESLRGISSIEILKRVIRLLTEKNARVVNIDATVLAEEPKLINGTIDWGNGDFETALGGASHMGRRDIAEYLLEHNARLDIFAATMLGKLDIVKAAVAAFPNIVYVPGPHGIPLIVHAEKGGPAAKDVLEFLRPLAGQSVSTR